MLVRMSPTNPQHLNHLSMTTMSGSGGVPAGGDSSVVARTSGGPDSVRHHRICQASMGFLSAAQGKVPHPGDGK